MKSLFHGDFIKDHILHAVQCVSPKSVNDLKRISVSKNTITRRVEELFCNIEIILIEKVCTCVFYLLASDEKTNRTDTGELTIFGWRLIIISIYLKSF